jgi:multidrug efflux pump subunit AcrA (membrane-fusion protein)
VIAGAVVPAFAQNFFALKEVQPATMETLRAREGGVLDSIEVAIGDEVTPKQILARLDHDKQLHTYNAAKLRADNRGQLEIAEGDLMEKSAGLEEMRDRFRRRQVSDNQVQQSEGQAKTSRGKLEQAKMFVELAKLELLQAEKALEKRFFRATIQGTVIDISRAKGEKAAEGDIVVTVADLSELSSGIPMTKESAAALSTNTSLPVRIPGLNATRIARVESISDIKGSKSGEQMVRVVFSNPTPHQMLKNQVCEVLLPEGVKALNLAKEAPPAKPDSAKKPPASAAKS